MKLIKLVTRTVSQILRALLSVLLFWKRGKPKSRKANNIHDKAAVALGISSHHRSIAPPYWKKSTNTHADSTPSLPLISSMTLRQFLSHPDGFHLAMAPAFYGYFAYFGALIAFHEMEIHPSFHKASSESVSILPVAKAGTSTEHKILLQSVTGASAGAIAAAMIAFGADPRDAADFASSLTLDSFADPPAILAVFKGRLLQQIMTKFIQGAHLENARIPVAVTAFDLLTMKTRILNQGCGGRAARASATFPGLFQPVLCRNLIDATNSLPKTSLLVDGGIKDPFGLVGLSVLQPHGSSKRIVNMVVGGFGGPPPGPSQMPHGVHAAEVVSISIKHTPHVSPFKMQNGPKAVRAAKEAIADILDAPMYHGKEPGHYILPIDASSFCE